MNTLKIYVLIALLLINQLAIGQVNINLTPMNIGDYVPDIAISVDNQEVKISTLKGKLVVLDFWNIWCNSCVAAMPKLDSLQKQFEGKIQILLVTKNTKAEADKLFERIGRKTRNIPMIYGDSLLSRLFPHSGEPYHVWIDQGGRVTFLTSGYNTNSKSLSDFLNRKEVKLSRMGKASNWSDTTSLLPLKNVAVNLGVRTASIVTDNILEYYPNRYLRFIRDSVTNKISIVRAINHEIFDLFNIAFHQYLVPQKTERGRAPQNRIIVEVSDPYFKEPPKEEFKMDDWLQKHIFCYENKLQPKSEENIFGLMQQDLNRSFGFVGQIERRKMKCLVLIRNGVDMIKVYPVDKKVGVVYSRNKIEFRNAPIAELVNLLAYANDHLKLPIVDDTGIKEGVNITIQGKLRDIDSIRRQLQSYKLDLVEREMKVNMLVIRDKEKPDH